MLQVEAEDYEGGDGNWGISVDKTTYRAMIGLY